MSVAIDEYYRFGVITLAQYRRASHYRVRSCFLTREGKLVIISDDNELTSIARNGTIWMQYKTSSKIANTGVITL